MFPSVLIIDDEPSILQSLSGLLSDEGFSVITATNGYEGLKIIENQAPDVVLLDIWMPGIDGIDTLREIRKENPMIQVIVITGHGNVETAVKATKLGAFDMIEKPLSIDKVILGINKALNFRRLEEENRYLRKKTIEKNSITGQSAPTQALKHQIAVTAPTDSWILITGENGTGKELVARTIHQFSRRAEAPLIDVNCAALSEGQIERELFGHEKGAIPGVDAKKYGRLELAAGGTLFFDEIADMGLKTQAKLLRVLQEQQFQRIGGSRVITVDVRVIAATNRDLEEEIRRRTFREDLYYRLNVVPIRVPALRERKDDIPALVEVFLNDCAGRTRERIKQITSEAMEMLMNYSWPGNVRELKNLVGRLVIMTDSPVIEADDLPAPYNPIRENPVGTSEETLFKPDSLSEAVGAFEEIFIRRKYRQFGEDANRCAEALGISREHLEARLGLTESR
jgi:two-component system nitrogen regulation response regulator NtrX